MRRKPHPCTGNARWLAHVAFIIAVSLGPGVGNAQEPSRRGLADDSPFRLSYALDLPISIAGLGLAI